MGFDCGFHLLPKYKDVNVAKVKLITAFIRWKNNPWNFKENRYPTWQSYWENFVRDFNDKTEVAPSLTEDEIEFYEKYFEGVNEETKICDGEIQALCGSCAHYIDGYLSRHLEKIDEYTYDGFNDKFIEEALHWVLSEKEKYQPVLVNVKKSITFEDDKEILTDCDGVVVIDPKMNYHFVTDEYDCLWYNDNEDFDFITYALEVFRDFLNNIKYLNKEDYLIWYSCSF